MKISDIFEVKQLLSQYELEHNLIKKLRDMLENKSSIFKIIICQTLSPDGKIHRNSDIYEDDLPPNDELINYLINRRCDELKKIKEKLKEYGVEFDD